MNRLTAAAPLKLAAGGSNVTDVSLAGLVGVWGPGLPEQDQTLAHRLLPPRTRLPRLHPGHPPTRGNANAGIHTENTHDSAFPPVLSKRCTAECRSPTHSVAWMHTHWSTLLNSVCFVQVMVLWSWSLSSRMCYTSFLISITFHHTHTHTVIKVISSACVCLRDRVLTRLPRCVRKALRAGW